MTSRSYFGKMNSILGSVVPLAMFRLNVSRSKKSFLGGAEEGGRLCDSRDCHAL